jgi:hypothetical protein
VQRRFLQRLRGSALALDYNHGVAETSPFSENLRKHIETTAPAGEEEELKHRGLLMLNQLGGR